MQVAIIVLLLVLIGAVFYYGRQMSSKNAGTVVPAPFDTDAITRTVQTAINLDAISTSVKGAVEAQMLTTAQQALASNNEQAQQNAKQTLESQAAAIDAQAKLLLQPIAQQMEALQGTVKDLQGSYTAEQATVQALAGQVNVLQDSTTSLKNALKSPTARGSWGENQLRTVMQMAGMENYCDYTEQFTGGESERTQRPDAVVNLPTGGRIAIDSKAPFNAYLRMQESVDPATQELELANHAAAIRNHARALARKEYWNQFGHSTPDFVVMFIPNEGAVADAMKSDINLLADAMRDRVLIASPVNLLALLLTIAKGWQSHQLEENAERVAKLAKEMYDRVGTMLEHVVRMGNNLRTANNSYDAMIGSMEHQLLVTMRRFKELGVIQENEPMSTLQLLDRAPRAVRAPEATELPSASAGEIEA
ncbi:MAG: DNA recombination protein RmuC [Actinobacteria bacterium]|nr:DNA recombination protein RmuC [Actinomycetota bacterium]